MRTWTIGWMCLATLGCAQPEPVSTDQVSVDTGAADEPDWWTQSAADADGDGYTVAQGDCDDGRDDVHPGVTVDLCDGRDSDCDHQVDEDFDLDEHEPNDSVPAQIGSLVDEGQLQVYGYLFHQPDVDRYEVEIEEDTFGWFDLEVWLYGTPEGSVYEVELYYTENGSPELLGSDLASGRGSMALVNYPGVFGTDDSGSYEIVVRSLEGSSCAAPYTVHVLLGGF